jgi:hypothetical protein
VHFIRPLHHRQRISPADEPRVNPAPSCALNTFISAAAPAPATASKQTPPSVSVPSTSIRNSLIFFARFTTLAGNFSLFAAMYFPLSKRAARCVCGSV